jgi:hypothetical protein
MRVRLRDSQDPALVERGGRIVRVPGERVDEQGEDGPGAGEERERLERRVACYEAPPLLKPSAPGASAPVPACSASSVRPLRSTSVRCHGFAATRARNAPASTAVFAAAGVTASAATAATSHDALLRAIDRLPVTRGTYLPACAR